MEGIQIPMRAWDKNIAVVRNALRRFTTYADNIAGYIQYPLYKIVQLENSWLYVASKRKTAKKTNIATDG